MSRPEAHTTEWRIIGVSGDTIDGRQISAAELHEMAGQYDPEIYGARINLEHFRFLFPQWEGGYGDVLALKAEPWAKDRSKTALLAKMAVLPALQQLWDDGQKIYTSMEIMNPFADTGKAYLVGLAITDTPASLGTTANFSTAAKQAGGTLFTAYRLIETQETAMTDPKNQPAADNPLTEQAAEGLFARMLAAFKSEPEPEPPAPAAEPAGQDEKYTALQTELAAAAALVQKLSENQAAADKKAAELAAKHEKLQQDFAALLERLETEPASGERAPQTGSHAAEVGW